MIVHTDNLNPFQLDVLKEIGNIGAGNAATSLAKLLNKRVDMKPPAIKILKFEEIPALLGPEDALVAGIFLNVTGDITGDILIVFEYNDAFILADKLISKFDVPTADLRDIEISSLLETANILASSYISAIGTLTGLFMNISTPQIAFDMAGAILSVPAVGVSNRSDTVMYVETEYKDGKDKVIGNFFLVPDEKSFEILLKSLGVTNNE